MIQNPPEAGLGHLSPRLSRPKSHACATKTRGDAWRHTEELTRDERCRTPHIVYKHGQFAELKIISVDPMIRYVRYNYFTTYNQCHNRIWVCKTRVRVLRVPFLSFIFSFLFFIRVNTSQHILKLIVSIVFVLGSASGVCFVSPFIIKISKSAIRRAAILDFLILSGIPWIASVDPVRNGFSIPKKPYVQIFIMLSSESEHLFDISTILHRVHARRSS